MRGALEEEDAICGVGSGLGEDEGSASDGLGTDMCRGTCAAFELERGGEEVGDGVVEVGGGRGDGEGEAALG